ncbi:MAG: extracellular solute-binding protein [Chloroflexi bacterium]|nr:MAG: extracellular solute-binding protein [Chloroflexota bacterium]
MLTTRTVACAVVVALLTAAAPAVITAQGAVQLKYYYPVGVSGPLNKLMTEMVGDFNAAHPDIKVEPVFAGNYVEAMAKAMTGVMGGNPPDVAVLDTPELFSTISTAPFY